MTTRGRYCSNPVTYTTIDGGQNIVTREWDLWHFRRKSNVYLRNAGWVRPTKRKEAALERSALARKQAESRRRNKAVKFAKK